MGSSSFEELQSRLREIYQNQDYAQAFDLASHQLSDFPEQKHILNYWRIAMAARTGALDQSVQILTEVLDTGFWYGEGLLRKSPSLSNLQGKPEFEFQVRRSLVLQEKDQTSRFPIITLRSQGKCIENSQPCPLLIGLHTELNTAHASLVFWREAATHDWLVAAPQSSQALWKDAYVWDDREVTVKEINKHLATLSEKYRVDLSKVVIAGHSAGGEAAMWLALNGGLPVCGFIAIGPMGPLIDDPEVWKPLIKDYSGKNLRGYFVIGTEDDHISQDVLLNIVDDLNENGIVCDLEEVMGAGHEYQPQYSSSLMRGLKFILGT